MSTVRLFLDMPMENGATLGVERDHAHYLFNVMRLGPGDTISVFNGVDGEWTAQVVDSGKRRGTLALTERTRAQTRLPDIELLFAPVKKARTDFIVEKAAELGCGTVRPIFTRYTNSERLNLPRLKAHMVEAAEQCGEIAVPTLSEPAKLGEVLDRWDTRLLIFCDESRTAPDIAEALNGVPCGTPASVLIGPEGGFSPEERGRIRGVGSAVGVSLGPRILRADTACVVALCQAQAILGDWGDVRPGHDAGE